MTYLLKKKGFSFFLQWGLCFDIEVGHKNWGYYSTEYYDWQTDKLLDVVVSTKSYPGGGWANYVFHTGFGFSYQFNSGIGISLSGKHNIGLLYVNELSYNIKYVDADTDIIEREFKEQSASRSESWNILLGVTYTFKQKKKE